MNFEDFDNFNFDNIPIPSYQCCTILNGELVHYTIQSEDGKFYLACDGSIIAWFNSSESAINYLQAEFL